MKKCSITCLFVTVLFLFVTFFSMSLTPVHTDDCQHSVCEYCEEIVAVEKAVNVTLEEHSECMEIACETCIFIEKQIERLGELKTTEHSCHEVICDTCIRLAFGKCLQLFICVWLIFALGYFTTQTIHRSIKEKTPIERAFTLLTLKVRLND